jgi:predicted PurR-regulated permease PerM
VVLSTFLAAVLQAGVFATALLTVDLIFRTGLGEWVGLLALVGAACAMVPFLGVTAVWLPLCVYWIVQGQYAAAASLAIFSAVVITQVDNLVRALVLRGSANLHPLLGIISIIGGIQFLGVAGVFVGPIVAAVLVAILRILRDELERMSAPRIIRP